MKIYEIKIEEILVGILRVLARRTEVGDRARAPSYKLLRNLPKFPNFKVSNGLKAS